jgi:hypothetical protein
MKLKTIPLLVAAAVALSTDAFAQLPNSKVLTMDVAQSIAQETLASCRAAGYKVTVLVATASAHRRYCCAKTELPPPRRRTPK